MAMKMFRYIGISYGKKNCTGINCGKVKELSRLGKNLILWERFSCTGKE